jgi:hypothetical protein
MDPFKGHHHLTGPKLAQPQTGPCVIVVAGGGLQVTPQGGATLPVRFTEIRDWGAADFTLWLELHDGSRLELTRLARRFDELTRVIKDSRREHFAPALLLDEPGGKVVEKGAFERRRSSGETLDGGPCAVHLQATSLAVYPEVAAPFLVPYGTIVGARHDPEAYGLALTRDDDELLLLTRFAKRTDAVARGLEERRAALAGRQSAALSALAPGLGAVTIRDGAELLRDGVPAERDALERAAPGLWDAVWKYGFNEERRAYAEALRARASRCFAVIKETGPWGAAEGTPAALADRRLLYLFEVGRALVLEAPSADDAATYVFRVAGDAEPFARALCRALAAVQFRREPIYLEESAMRGEHERYAEAVRVLPELAAVRGAWVGRAIHRSVEAWGREVDEAVGRAGAAGA